MLWVNLYYIVHIRISLQTEQECVKISFLPPIIDIVLWCVEYHKKNNNIKYIRVVYLVPRHMPEVTHTCIERAIHCIHTAHWCTALVWTPGRFPLLPEWIIAFILLSSNAIYMQYSLSNEWYWTLENRQWKHNAQVICICYMYISAEIASLMTSSPLW